MAQVALARSANMWEEYCAQEKQQLQLQQKEVEAQADQVFAVWQKQPIKIKEWRPKRLVAMIHKE